MPYKPFPRLVQKKREGIAEQGRYGRAFAGLVQGVMRSVGRRAVPVKAPGAALLHGPTCIKRSYPCYGDNYDAAYLISPQMKPKDSEKLRIIARACVKPGKVVGPDYFKLIKPRIIRFWAK